MGIKELFRKSFFWLSICLMICSGASELAMAQWHLLMQRLPGAVKDNWRSGRSLHVCCYNGNQSCDFRKIWCENGPDEIYDRIRNFMCDMLPAGFCFVESDNRFDWMYYLWLFCWDYVARHNQYFIRKISGRWNGYVCFACYGGGSGWKHRSGDCWTCYTKCWRQYSCGYGGWTFVPGYFINHAFYFCEAKGS